MELPASSSVKPETHSVETMQTGISTLSKEEDCVSKVSRSRVVLTEILVEVP